MNRVAVIADIEKAFPQIKIAEEDQEFLRYLWFDNIETNKISCYQMTSLLFGATSSPFILAAVIRHHLSQNSTNFPLAAAVKDCFYVDDLVVSVSTVEEADEIRNQLLKAFSLCSMNVRKWRSSDPGLDNDWKVEQKTAESTSVLGILWNVKNDSLSLKISKKDQTEVLTKRIFLSIITSLFDPLGFLSPCSLRGKKFLQKLLQQPLPI